MTWKLSMPSAENWQNLTDQLDVAEPKEEGQVTIQGDGTGMRWKFDEDMLERVASVLGVKFTMRVGDMREFIHGYGSMTYAELKFTHLPMLQDEKSPGTFAYVISVNPQLSPEAANYSIWHEIQHIFQFEEKRVDPMNMSYNPNLPMIGENGEKYISDPSETDADAMALKLHQLGMYPVVRTISWLEGTEGEEYAMLVHDEGWPPNEAMEQVKETIKANEIPLSTVMATRGLDIPDDVWDQSNEAVAKMAMPYFNNTWYHVTSVDYLDNIAQSGLQPRTESGQYTNWPQAAVAENAVYLWPTISMARGYFSRLPFEGREVILRVQNIEQAKMAPDHEVFTNWLDEKYGVYVGHEDDYNNEKELYTEIVQHSPTLQDEIDALQGNENDYIDVTYEAGLMILAELPPQLRADLVRHFAEVDPTEPVMYYGTIPPEDISVASLLTLEQLQEEFDEEHRDHPYLKGEYDEEAEEDYHEKLDQYLVNVMDEKQVREFISIEDLERMFEEALEDHSDEYAQNFTYKPLNAWQPWQKPTYEPSF